MTAKDVRPRVAIVDFGLGNLYSVARACAHVGLEPVVTASRADLSAAQGIILPGVGAFGDAMASLERLDLAGILRDAALADKPLLGVCLGVQLLMSRSEEFGSHRGLDILKGSVVRFEHPREGEGMLKIPQIGWNGIFRVRSAGGGDPWTGSPLEGQRDGEPMYFVHSYYVQPQEEAVILSTTRYGQIEFCSSVRVRRVFACQFHPERSGPAGLRIYEKFGSWLRPGPI